MKKLAFLLLFCGIASAGDNWPQWRGPSLDGTTDAKNLPLKWSEEKNVKWKVKIPSWSGSSPVIWGDKIFVTTASDVGDGREAQTFKKMARVAPQGRELLLLCYSKKDGKELWRKTLAGKNFISGKQNMASPSPMTDGKTVWAMTGTGTVAAFDLDGKELWTISLTKKYGKFGQNFGYGASPLLYDGKIIIPVLHGMMTKEPSYIVAIDGKTGAESWKVERPTKAKAESPDAYTTPVPMKVGDKVQILISGADCVTGHDLETGKEIWRCAGINPKENPYYRTVASPVVVGDIIVACAKRGPTIAIKDGKELWTSPLSYDVPTPVTDGKYLYLLNDRGRVSCLDPKTGQAHYENEKIGRGIYDASPLLAGDRIYCTNEKGDTTVIATGPEFKVLAENPLDDDYTLASMAVSGSELFIRTSTHLYCISEEK